MYTEDLIKRIAKKSNIDISEFDIKELIMGMAVELEHGSVNDKTDVTGDDPEATFKIVIAHMHEMPDYYTKLKAMEGKKENISEYARRMRELAGLSEGNQNKSLKTINEGDSSFENGMTFYAKDMTGVVKENFDTEEFIPNGSYTISNSGGYEIMLNDSGDAAKVRDAYGSDNPKTSDWLEIEYVNSEDGELDDEGYPETEAVIDPNGYNIPLNQVMRINENKSPEKEDEFETHKFEQRKIEEGENDQELYTLNENTIIVLDFLDEDSE